MYAVTYQADELPLCPEIRGAQIVFSGDLDLDARPSGEWTISNIWVATAITPPVGVMPLIGKERLSSSNALYPLIEKAARAHDRRTGLIAAHVADEMETILPAARRDAARAHLSQAAE